MKPTISQFLAQARRRPRHQRALTFKKQNRWQSLNWEEFYRRAEALGLCLIHHGAKPGDRVAIMSDTRPEWIIADQAILGVNAVTVPIYQSQRSEEVAYIVNDSEPRILIVENADQLKKWLEISQKCPSVKHVILIEGSKEKSDKAQYWEDSLREGMELAIKHPMQFQQSIGRQKISDVATIVYTSGTTGEPKGAVLTHEQIASEIAAIQGSVQLNEKDVSLSFLPYAHVLGRIESWAAVVIGFELAFAESVDRLRQNLVEVRPTFLIAVPRIFEKLYEAIQAQLEISPTSQKIFNQALVVGKQVSQLRQEKKALSPQLAFQFSLVDRFVFRTIRAKLGGRLRFSVSGGAPLSRDLCEFFHAIGILILEGYGLTETTAAISANSSLNYKFGSVGRPFPGVEIKIANDGEILVKSLKVMKEYYHQPESTALALEGGYFHTGDIGEIDANGFLYITDRKKDLIKTAGGKYVAPQKLENLLKMSPYISQALIHGDQEKYVVALLTLNREPLIEFAKKQDLSYQDFATLTQHPAVKGLIRGVVANINNQLASFETIKNFGILPRDFQIEAGEVTPSLKIKRKFCSEKYRTQINELYS